MTMKTITLKGNFLTQKVRALSRQVPLLMQKAFLQKRNQVAHMLKVNLQLHIQRALTRKVRAHRLAVSQLATSTITALMLMQRV